MPLGLNKKTIIQLVVIIVAFGIAGVVLFNGFFAGNNNAALQTELAKNAVEQPQELLPFGNTLDFSRAINPKRFQYNQIEYQKLDPKNDVGVSPDNLVVPLPAVQTGP